MIKMAALDLDRTLLRDDKSVSDYTRQVIAQWRASGRKLVLASARPMRTMQEYITLLEADGAAIGNGALVWTPVYQRQIPMDHDDVERFLEDVLDAFPDSTISAEIDDTLYANFDIPEWSPTILRDFRHLPQGNVRKVLVTYVDEAHLGRIRQMIRPGMRLSVSNRQIIQLQHSDAEKWNAVQELAAQWGIERAEIACFGDDWDDLRMIREAGWGVAVGNALEEVKAVADEIALDNESDGPAWVMERLMEEK